MNTIIETVEPWITEIGLNYGVNPVVFGILYLASTPPYLVSIGWIIRNYRRNKSLTLPLISTGIFFIVPALYLLISGRNVPWWIYGILALLIGYGVFTAYRSIKVRLNRQTGRVYE